MSTLILALAQELRQAKIVGSGMMRPEFRCLACDAGITLSISCRLK
jgi:hypothetical protein